jgi:hypothetical protein
MEKIEKGCAEKKNQEYEINSIKSHETDNEER